MVYIGKLDGFTDSDFVLLLDVRCSVLNPLSNVLYTSIHHFLLFFQFILTNNFIKVNHSEMIFPFKYLRFLFNAHSCSLLLLVLLVLAGQFKISAQSSGCLSGRFGIDGGLYSGVIEFGAGQEPASPPRSNDWFQGAEGLGVIDESNPGILQALLQAPGNPTYKRRMSANPLSINEGQIWIDAVFARDNFGGTGNTDPTSFLTASKNGQNPASWDPGPANVLGKNDIIDFGGMMFRNGTSLETGDLWFVGLYNMAEPGGTSYMDFEFFVEQISYEPATGFSSGGQQLGHTAYNFNLAQNGVITKVGDFIFSVSLLSSGPVVDTRLWVSRSDWVALGGPTQGTTATFQWTGTFDGAFNNAPFGYAGIQPLGPDQVCGYTNQPGENPQAPPWGTKNTKSHTYQTTYQVRSISEVAINLTAMGMDHASLEGLDDCEFPLNSFVVKTRASASFTAQLKDFAGPFSWAQPTFTTEISNTEISCDNETATVTSIPQRTDVTYAWSTINGNILSGQGTSQILVDKPGTYEVEIITPDGCPNQGASATVGLDPAFPFFDGPPEITFTSSCDGINGTITATASGATQPYTFFLYDDLDDLITSAVKSIGESSHTFTGLAPGTYRVDVQGQAACIETSGPIEIPAREPIVLDGTPSVIDCFGDSNGELTLDITGNINPVTIEWSNGTTSQNLVNISAGSYTVTVTDVNGCETTDIYTVTQNSLITAAISKTDDPGNDGDGSATINVSGGTSPYVYLWEKTGDPAFVFTPSDDVASITDLSYGEYTVTVTDDLGCQAVFTTFIFEKEICNDGIDNSGNGLIDCDDPECEPAPSSPISFDPSPVCVGETITYSVIDDPEVDEYVWTVPSNATLLSGQGTHEIEVVWNTVAGGQICVKTQVFDCLSDPVCIETDVEDVPPSVNGISID